LYRSQISHIALSRRCGGFRQGEISGSERTASVCLFFHCRWIFFGGDMIASLKSIHPTPKDGRSLETPTLQISSIQGMWVLGTNVCSARGIAAGIQILMCQTNQTPWSGIAMNNPALGSMHDTYWIQICDFQCCISLPWDKYILLHTTIITVRTSWISYWEFSVCIPVCHGSSVKVQWTSISQSQFAMYCKLKSTIINGLEGQSPGTVVFVLKHGVFLLGTTGPS
jgi:hypothetical protein